MGLVKEGLLAVVSGDRMEEQAEARLECSKVEGRLRDGAPLPSPVFPDEADPAES